MAKVTIMCVGGFLGAGKTTALQAAARELIQRGLKPGIITNDQGSELVDTESMRSAGLATKEIVGGCFCCKFDDLIQQAGELLDQANPDIILAEAVGSCTDLSATVYQPLRRYYGDQYTLAPLSILAEPNRIRTFLDHGGDGFPESVQYLFKKQLAEADLIVLNKTDTINEAEREELGGLITNFVGNIPLHPISALTNQGVAEWVDMLLSGRRAGERILDINYQTYAEAEAVLGWLNATVEMTSSQDILPAEVAEALIERIQRNSVEAGMAIAHLKILVATDLETNRIALTGTVGQPQWSAKPDFPAVDKLSLIINARIGTTPEDLTKAINDSIAATAKSCGIQANVMHLESFSPLPPQPRYRFAET
jgi:G3E family GTPase